MLRRCEKKKERKEKKEQEERKIVIYCFLMHFQKERAKEKEKCRRMLQKISVVSKSHPLVDEGETNTNVTIKYGEVISPRKEKKIRMNAKKRRKIINKEIAE